MRAIQLLLSTVYWVESSNFLSSPQFTGVESTGIKKKNGRFVNSTFEREVQLSFDLGSFGGSLYPW